MRKLKELKIKYEFIKNDETQQRLGEVFDYIFNKIIGKQRKNGALQKCTKEYN